ncbi:MAG: hypothetical protein JW794_05665 [Candidatus Cloacimonetes bacterium]|nr:hypothetical protein [Candidatus Cloacimonadota bacterium]
MKKIIMLLLAALFIIIGCSKSPKKILVIYSYHPEYEWCKQEKKGIYEIFNDQDITIESFYMDTKRKTDKTWEKNVTTEAIQKIDSFKPDIVIVCDDNACRLVASKYIDKKFPFIFTGINGDPEDYGMPAKNITGVIERNLIEGTIGLLQQLDPSVRSVAIITDNSVTSQAAVTRFTQENFPVDLYDVFMTDNYDDWKKYVRKIHSEVDALGIYLYFTLRDPGSDESIPNERVLNWTLDNTPIPTFSFEAFSVLGGVLCGETQSGYEQGREAALMAKEILSGTKPSQLTVRMPKKGTLMVNEKTAQKLGITIPEDIQDEVKIIH